MAHDLGRATSGLRRAPTAHFTLAESGPGLATHLLADFLAVVSSFPTVRRVRR